MPEAVYDEISSNSSNQLTDSSEIQVATLGTLPVELLVHIFQMIDDDAGISRDTPPSLLAR